MKQVKPYTYIITNEITDHWYIGKKTANEVPAVEDTTYWGSSNYLKKLMEEIPEGWTKTIIAEYDSDDETGLAEEKLIKEYWDLPGRVNKSKGCGKGCDFDDPEVKAKHLTATTSPEFRAKKSKQIKNQRASESEEIKQKRIDSIIAGKKARAKIIIATCIETGEEFEIRGTKEIESHGFFDANVRSCCNGKYSKTNIYKGHTFRYK
jgi:hypothetical protein